MTAVAGGFFLEAAPCARCQSLALKVVRSGIFYVECNNCGRAGMPGDSEAEALKLWNGS